MAQNLPEPGEFTKIFKRTHLAPQSGTDVEKKTGDASGIFQTADAAADLPRAEAGGTGAFPPTQPAPVQPPTVADDSPHKPLSSSQPGEFTQFFMGGLPAKTPSSNSTPARVPPGVQRPSPTVQSRNLVGDNSGSFTERFSRDSLPTRRPPEFGGRSAPIGPAPDLSRKPSPEPFDIKPPSNRDSPGEYTALFGRGELPPSPRQSAVKPAPAAPIMNDSPNLSSGGQVSERTLRDIPAPAATPQGPSEFTVISKGRQPALPADGSASPETAAGGDSAAATRKMPLPNVNLNINPANPLSALPSMAGGGGMHQQGVSANASLHGANVSTPVGSASAHGPQIPHVPPVPPLKLDAGAVGAGASKFSDQTKLILFFGVLAILAVILVVILVAKQKT